MREPNEADLRMRRAEQLRGAPGFQVRQQLNGDVHVIVTSREQADALFQRVSDSLASFVDASVTALDGMAGWHRANRKLLKALRLIAPERSYRMPRRRARRPAPAWRRRRRR